MATANKKTTVRLRSEVAEKFQLKPTITQAVIHVAGIVGEIDFTKITLEEIESYPQLQEFFKRK